ncbi:zinc finger, CCHC-type containing protein [Tanacetum coccineum]
MSNKKRSSRRQLKISIRPNDHVMSNLSQKKDAIDNSDNIEEIRVGDAGHVLEKDQMKGTYMEKERGVSGNTDYDVHTENNSNENDKFESVKTYATVAHSYELKFDTSLLFKQTKISDDGKEIVIFDDELVAKGSSKIDNINVNADGCCFFVEGIGAIASGLGTPLRMDTMTTQMCHEGVGQIEFARVLVEFDVEKGFKNVIDIHYKDKQNKTKGKKSVMVEYQWKPGICSHCKVFGHSIGKCDKRPRTVEEIEITKKKKEQSNENMKDRDGFRDVFRKNRNFQGKVNSTFNKYQSKPTVREEQIKAIKTTANKYVVLSQNELEEKSELNMLKDRIIEEDRMKEKDLQNEDEEDAVDIRDGIAGMCGTYEIKGKNDYVLN